MRLGESLWKKEESLHAIESFAAGSWIRAGVVPGVAADVWRARESAGCRRSVVGLRVDQSGYDLQALRRFLSICDGWVDEGQSNSGGIRDVGHLHDAAGH